MSLPSFPLAIRSFYTRSADTHLNLNVVDLGLGAEHGATNERGEDVCGKVGASVAALDETCTIVAHYDSVSAVILRRLRHGCHLEHTQRETGEMRV